MVKISTKKNGRFRFNREGLFFYLAFEIIFPLLDQSKILISEQLLNIKTRLFLLKKQGIIDNKTHLKENEKKLLWDDKQDKDQPVSRNYKLKTKYFIRENRFLISSAIGLVIFATVTATILIRRDDSTGNSKGFKSTSVLGSNSPASSTINNGCPNGNEKPKFKLIFPDNKTVESVGGICLTSPPGNAPTFTYIDNINNSEIKVNQQELPDTLDSEEELSAFATTNYYNSTFYAGNVKVYSGKDIKGSQFLIFVKNRLLVLIRSEKQQNDGDWVRYIQSLK